MGEREREGERGGAGTERERGCTRASLMRSTSVRPHLVGLGNLCKRHRDGDRVSSSLAIPSKRESSAGADYVLALCTRRPSLLLIE